MSRSYLSGVSLALCLTAVACGGGGTEEGGSGFAEEIDFLTAHEVADKTAGYISAVANDLVQGHFGPGLPTGSQALSAATRVVAMLEARAYQRSGDPTLAAASRPFRSSSACVPIEIGVDGAGEMIDSDGDGVPDDYQVTFPAGCTVTGGGYTTTYSGIIRLRDQPGLVGYRFDVAKYEEKQVKDLNGDYQYLAMNGTETGIYTASAITLAAGMTETVGYHYSSSAASPLGAGFRLAAQDGSQTLDYVVSASYTPDIEITLKEPIPSGDLTLDVDLRIINTGDEGPDSFHFLIGSRGALHYDNYSCQGLWPGVVDATLNGHDNVGFTIDWVDCYDYIIETFGTSG